MNITGITGLTGTKFSVSPATATIAAGGSQAFTITCDGSAAGTFTATMAVAHDATGSPANYTLSCTVSTAAVVTAGVTLTSVSPTFPYTATATATGTGIGERGFYRWIPPTTATHFGGSESGLIPEGYGAGSFSLTLTGLKPGNSYHVKAYVKVGGQIITSDEQLFTTATSGATGNMAPTVLTDNYTVSGNSITVSGEITDIGAFHTNSLSKKVFSCFVINYCGSNFDSLIANWYQVNVYGFVYAPHTAPFTGDEMPKTGDMTYAMWDQTPLYQGMKFTGIIKWYLRTYAHNVNQDSSASQPESLSYGQEISFTVACTPETCIPGDVNGDGNVSLNDARILAGMSVSNVNLNADVNGDGKIGLEELGYILQKVAGLRPSGT